METGRAGRCQSVEVGQKLRQKRQKIGSASSAHATILKRREMKEELPTPKRARRLPTVLTPDEVKRLISGAKNLYHRTMLLVLYGCGLRRSELLQLKVADIDSQRMVIRIDRGKGGQARGVPPSPTLLQALREYYLYRWMQVLQHAAGSGVSLRRPPSSADFLRQTVRGTAPDVVGRRV
jgi:integrase